MPMMLKKAVVKSESFRERLSLTNEGLLVGNRQRVEKEEIERQVRVCLNEIGEKNVCREDIQTDCDLSRYLSEMESWKKERADKTKGARRTAFIKLFENFTTADPVK